MAAKAKVSPKGKSAPLAKGKSKARAAPKGLQLSAAQAKAYTKAFNATATRLRNAAVLRGRATGLRKYRLAAANATVRKYNIARGNAQRAAVAAHAASMSLRQSKLGNQNMALQRRIGLDAFRHTTLLGRMQFAQAGVKAYAHRAVMRTLTQGQAMSIEAAIMKRTAKTAKKAGAPRRKFPKGPNSPAITAAAKAAGAAAARKVGRPKTAAPTSKGTAKRGRPKGSTKAGPSSQGAVAQNAKANARAAAASKKAPVHQAKGRTAPMLGGWHAAMAAQAQAKKVVAPSKEWVGDEVTPNCVIAAVANHLMWAKLIVPDEASVKELTEACSEEPTIEEVLWQAWLMHWPRNSIIHLGNYKPAAWRGAKDVSGLVIGYSIVNDEGLWADHAALAMPEGKVISWGSLIERDQEVPIEEAWELTWVG